jgi:hypothetical protein
MCSGSAWCGIEINAPASGRLEEFMRAAILALMAIGTLSVIHTAPAEARSGGPAYPVCLRTWYGDDDCSFTNFQQCMWSASGLGEDCFANPALAYAAPPIEEPAPPRRHHHHRRDS